MKSFLKILSLIFVILITIGITYILIPRPYQVHYHANFAVYIEGKQWDFGRDIYMEETSRCNITTNVKPQDRIHLHENKGDLVHVHMAAATWGDLFANLLWNTGSGYLVDDYGKMYVTGSSENIYYFINGESVTNPENLVVESEDQLLVWYGTGSAQQVKQGYLSKVAKTAHEYNQKSDPASCGSNDYGWLSPIATAIHEWLKY